jgi:hypothetical protein
MSNPYLLHIGGLFVAVIAIVAAPWAVLGLRGETSRHRAWIVASLAGGLAGLVYLTWMWEVVLGLVAHVVILGAFILFGLVLAAVVYRRQRSWLALGFGAIATVAILLLHAVDLSPVKPYRRFFDSIQIGMTPAEVRSLLDREFPGDGRFRVPHAQFTADRIFFNLDLSDGRYNAESIQFPLRDGRVAGKEYLGD